MTTPQRSTDSRDAQHFLQNPSRLRNREDVLITSETQTHDDADYCVAELAGQIVVAVENDDGELLLLGNDEFGIVVLPHGNVEEGDDWAATAREEIEALTGISISLDDVEILRQIEHVADGEPHGTTFRVVFTGRPVGGTIQECKQSADAGNDNWWAFWASDLPADLDVPGGGPGDDLRHFLA